MVKPVYLERILLHYLLPCLRTSSAIPNVELSVITKDKFGSNTNSN